MALKNRMYIALVCASVLSAASLGLLVAGYFLYFRIWITLSLLLSVSLMIGCWGWYYLLRTRYKESLNKKGKKKFYGRGNRKNRRKGR